VRPRTALVGAVQEAEVVADIVRIDRLAARGDDLELLRRARQVRPLDQDRGSRVAEDEMAVAVAPVQVAAGDLRIEHQHRARLARLHRVGRGLDAEGGRGAGHVHVEAEALDAQRLLHFDGDGRIRALQIAAGDHDHVDVLRRPARTRQRIARASHGDFRQHREFLVAALRDARHHPLDIEHSGIDTQYIDQGVRVQDDFFGHLNGKWLKTTEIPSDRTSWGTFMKLRDDTQAQMRGIIEADQKKPGKKAGSDEQKIGDLYTSFMDEKKLETLGYQAAGGELQRIRALKDKKGVPALVAHLSQIGVATPTASAWPGCQGIDQVRDLYPPGRPGSAGPRLLPEAGRQAHGRHQGQVRAARRQHPDPGRRQGRRRQGQGHRRLRDRTGQGAVDPRRAARPEQELQQDERGRAVQADPGLRLEGRAGRRRRRQQGDYVIVGQPSYITGFNARC
jgi:hypothetical protein